MVPIASLPMYDFPDIRLQTDLMWAEIRKQFRNHDIMAPKLLNRSADLWAQWQNPELIFGQTCGYPFVTKLRDTVTLIGTPDYGVIPNKPGWYNSVILCRATDPRTHITDFKGADFTFNESASQSGCWAMMFTLLQEIGEKRHFGSCHKSGGHAASALAVASGQADIASVDVVTWGHLQRIDPNMAKLRVLSETPPTPGLPYIAAKSYDKQIMQNVLKTAIKNAPSKLKKTLGIVDFWASEESDYDLISERAILSQGVFSAHISDHS